jgi:hypothetical protein
MWSWVIEKVMVYIIDKLYLKLSKQLLNIEKKNLKRYLKNTSGSRGVIGLVCISFWYVNPMFEQVNSQFLLFGLVFGVFQKWNGIKLIDLVRIL